MITLILLICEFIQKVNVAVRIWVMFVSESKHEKRADKLSTISLFLSFLFPCCFILRLLLCPLLLFSSLCHGWVGQLSDPASPSPTLLPDRCQQGGAALTRVSPTTTVHREWGNQARVIYAGPEHTGQRGSARSVCFLLSVHVRAKGLPLLQHPAINLLWHVKLNLWANLLATDMFDLKRERRIELKKMQRKWANCCKLQSCTRTTEIWAFSTKDKEYRQ